MMLIRHDPSGRVAPAWLFLRFVLTHEPAQTQINDDLSDRLSSRRAFSSLQHRTHSLLDP